MTSPFAAVAAVPVGAPVLVEAAVGMRRWWARIRQFRSTAYVEVWNDAGFDAEAVVPTADVASAMRTSLAGRCDLPTAAADVVFRAALTFAAATVTGAGPATPQHRRGALTAAVPMPSRPPVVVPSA